MVFGGYGSGSFHDGLCSQLSAAFTDSVIDLQCQARGGGGDMDMDMDMEYELNMRSEGKGWLASTEGQIRDWELRGTHGCGGVCRRQLGRVGRVHRRQEV